MELEKLSVKWLSGSRASTRSCTRRSLSLYGAIAFVLITFSFLSWQNRDRVAHSLSEVYDLVASDHGSPVEHPPCLDLDGTDDIVVVMKTGANEVADKLDTHLRTTMKCFPNKLIFSDFEETLPSGQHIYDAFEFTTPSIRETHEDFALWRQLQEVGRLGLPKEELSGADSHEKPEEDRMKIPGWHLDKWKFLPMVNQTLHLYPDKHWYVFVETDTYLVWSSLLPYLKTLSWQDDLYVGNEVIITIPFAHGGSGFFLSRPALEKVVAHYNNEKERFEFDTSERWWVGDDILANALFEAGVPLTNIKPTLKGEPVGMMSFKPDDDLWCSRALSFHHQSPPRIMEFWEFEQNWLLETGRHGRDQTEAYGLRHKDIFEAFVKPQMHRLRPGWDNLSDDEHDMGPAASMSECRARCEQDETCLQYSYREGDHSCRLASYMKLGWEAEGIDSEWLEDRIEKHVATWPTC